MDRQTGEALERMLVCLRFLVCVCRPWRILNGGYAPAHGLEQVHLSASTIPGVLRGMLRKREANPPAQIRQFRIGVLVEVVLRLEHEALPDDRHRLDPTALGI